MKKQPFSQYGTNTYSTVVLKKKPQTCSRALKESTMFALYSLFVATAVMVLTTLGHVEGFVVLQSVHRPFATTLSAHSSSRRSFAVATMGATFAALTTAVAPGFALDDLDMPAAGSAEAQAVRLCFPDCFLL